MKIVCQKYCRLHVRSSSRVATAIGNFINFSTHQTIALIAAAEGKTGEAEENVQLFLREARLDMTNYSTSAAESCRILGMAGATTAAVDCLREAFVKPSTAHSFLEPLLPFFGLDSRRAGVCGVVGGV